MLRSAIRSIPMPQPATIKCILAARRMIAATQAQAVEYKTDYRPVARLALRVVLEAPLGVIAN